MSLQKEDVYETEDPLPSEAIETEEQFDDQDIEKIHVDIDGALKLFGNRLLNADDVDFSDPLFRKRRGYRSGNYVLELVGSDRRAEETPDQKFARLKSEIEELSQAVKERKSANDESAVLSKEELNSLNDLLNAVYLQKSNAGSDISSKRESAGTEAAPHKSEAESSTKDLIKLKNIDERIQRIEEAISGGRHFHDKSEPLAETLENLKIQVDSLNPVYMEGVQEYLNTVIKKLGEVEKQRKKTQPDDLEEKINKLYKLVTEWDITCANVPMILKRLHALSKLHEQAQNFSLKLNDLSLVKEHLEKKAENQKVILFELKRDSTKIIAELTEKVNVLDKRIKQLK